MPRQHLVTRRRAPAPHAVGSENGSPREASTQKLRAPRTVFHFCHKNPRLASFNGEMGKRKTGITRVWPLTTALCWGLTLACGAQDSTELSGLSDSPADLPPDNSRLGDDQVPHTNGLDDPSPVQARAQGSIGPGIVEVESERHRLRVVMGAGLGKRTIRSNRHQLTIEFPNARLNFR